MIQYNGVCIIQCCFLALFCYELLSFWWHHWQRFICFTETYVRYESQTSHLSKLCYSVTIFGLTENCLLKHLSGKCFVLLYFHGYTNIITAQTIITHKFTVLTAKVVVCVTAIWQSNNLCRDSIIQDWLHIFSSEIDFLFFFSLTPYVIVLSLAPLDKNDFKTKPFTPRKWFQSHNQSRHEHKTEIATSVRLQKRCAMQMKSKASSSMLAQHVKCENVKFCSHYAICPQKLSPLRIKLLIHWLYIDNIHFSLDIYVYLGILCHTGMWDCWDC